MAAASAVVAGTARTHAGSPVESMAWIANSRPPSVGPKTKRFPSTSSTTLRPPAASSSQRQGILIESSEEESEFGGPLGIRVCSPPKYVGDRISGRSRLPGEHEPPCCAPDHRRSIRHFNHLQ